MNRIMVKLLLALGLLMAVAACTPADEEYCQSFGVAGTAEFGKCLDFYHREEAAFGTDRAVCDAEADMTYPSTLYDYGSTQRVMGGFMHGPFAGPFGGPFGGPIGGGPFVGSQFVTIPPNHAHNAQVDMLRMRIIEPCMLARGWNSGATWQAGRRPVTPAKPRPKPAKAQRQLQPTGSMNLPWLQ